MQETDSLVVVCANGDIEQIMELDSQEAIVSGLSSLSFVLLLTKHASSATMSVLLSREFMPLRSALTRSSFPS